MQVEPISADKFLSMQQMEKFVRFFAKCWDDPAWQERLAVCMLVLGTGVRVTELCNVKVPDDADYDGRIYLRKATTKTKRERLIRIPPWFLPWYRDWYRIVAWNGLDLSKADTRAPASYLIPRPQVSETGKIWVHPRKVGKKLRHGHWRKALPEEILLQKEPYKKEALQRMWKLVMKKLKIVNKTTRMSIHKGRHTFATHMHASRKLDIKEIQNQLGHKTMQMTTDMYAHGMGETLYDEDKTPDWIPLLSELYAKRIERLATHDEENDLESGPIEDIIRPERPDPKPDTGTTVGFQIRLSGEDQRWLQEMTDDIGAKSSQEVIRMMIKEYRRKERS